MAKKENEVSIIRSSAAEYLTFVAATGENKESVEMRYEDENIWLTQKMKAVLYNVSVSAINQHLKTIFDDNELMKEATIKKYLIVQQEGSRNAQRNVDHYNLQAIIAVGFKVNNERAVQFRKWANRIVKDYTIQGWVMDDERLKNGGTVLTNDYFEKQPKELERIVSAYLDMAEVQSERHIPITMADWEERLNGFLKVWDRDILQDKGKVTAEMVKIHAETEFEKYRIVQDRLYESDFDRFLLDSKGGDIIE